MIERLKPAPVYVEGKRASQRIPLCPEFDQITRDCRVAKRLVEQFPLIIQISTDLDITCPLINRAGVSRQDSCEKNPNNT